MWTTCCQEQSFKVHNGCWQQWRSTVIHVTVPGLVILAVWSNLSVYVMWSMHYNAHTVGWNFHVAAFELDEFQLETLAFNFDVHVLYWLCSWLKPNPRARAECKQPAASNRSYSDCAIPPFALTCAFSAFCRRWGLWGLWKVIDFLTSKPCMFFTFCASGFSSLKLVNKTCYFKIVGSSAWWQ